MLILRWLTFLKNTLERIDFFKGKVVEIDEQDDFNIQEMNLGRLF